MKNTNCKHCLQSCKVLGKNECEKYKAKADRPNQLPNLIREAVKDGDAKRVKELKDELNQFYYGKS